MTASIAQQSDTEVPLRNLILRHALAFLAMFALTAYADLLGVTHQKVVALWPACGLALWLIWRYGFTMLLPVVLGNYLFGLLFLPYDTSVASLGNMIGSAVAAALLRRQIIPEPGYALRNLLWVIGPATILQSGIAASIGGSYLAVNLGLSGDEILDLMLRWTISDIAGSLIIAPLLFTASLQRMRPRADCWRSSELILALMVCALVLLVIDLPLPAVSAGARVLLVSAPLLFWLAVRPPSFESQLAMLLTALVTLTTASQSIYIDIQEILETQIFICLFLACAQVMQALLSQQSDLNRQLARHSEALELTVAERTREANEARRRAESADAAKSEFLANTSHEVRTPLNAILGMAEFLSEGDLNSEQREQTETILAAGRHLMSVLNDVIDLSKVEAGKLEITAENVVMQDFASQLESLWKPIAREKGIGFRISGVSALPQALAFDAHRVAQCAANLLSNAIKFTERGQVTAHFDCQSDTACSHRLSLAVTDSGIGMSEEDQQRLFQPFEQLDASITRRYGGTGLGLAITRRLCELMDGTVSVRSAQGIGTTFTISIPTALGEFPGKSQAVPAAPSLDPHSTALRVLLVEDNLVNRKIAIGHLKSLGWQLAEAENGVEALALLETQPFDLMLCDVQMPVMDGIATTTAIRSSESEYRNIPIIALTANAMIDDRRKLLAIGMNGYASKPIDRSSLLAEIERVLANQSLALSIS